MALRNKILLPLVLLASSMIAECKIILPELLAKQAVGNIRFLSNAGNFTYYQKRSGSLLYSSNYKVIELLKGEIGTQYEVIGSMARKKLVIVQNVNFHNFYSIRANNVLYLIDYGQTQLREVGIGTNPLLHAEDSWLSYFNFYNRTIYFEHTTNSALKFSIKLNNRINPYFLPKVVMPDENTVYYTDLSESGAPGLLEFKRSTGKSEVLFKSPSAMNKIEICVQKGELIVGTFGINFSQSGSNIFKSPLPVADFSKRESIYNSQSNDLGQFICGHEGNKIFFIKNFGSTEIPAYDVVDLNTVTKEASILSEMKTITSIIDMDGTILALDKGRHLIVKGNADFKNVDSLKSLPPSGVGEAIKTIDRNRENE